MFLINESQSVSQSVSKLLSRKLAHERLCRTFVGVERLCLVRFSFANPNTNETKAKTYNIM